MAQSEQKRLENEQGSQFRAKLNQMNAWVIQGSNTLLDTTAFNQLKNRNGAAGDTLQYAYYSMFNKFLDMDSLEEPERQPQEAQTQVDDEGRVFSSTKEYREYLDKE